MATAAAPRTAPARLQSIDLVRGLVCVLMAIDHVRVYSGLPAGGPTADIFLTRWITHFVAPAFAFFAGTAAFYHGRKLGDMAGLSRFLMTRGALLVVLELTVIRFFWSFNPDLTSFVLAGVIWMLGWCMILLGLVVRLPARTVGWAGVAIVALQQLFGLPPRLVPAMAPVWAFLYPSGADAALGVNVLYVIVPWIGVMMAGYGFGLLLLRDDAQRRRDLLRLGLGLTAAFLVIGTVAAVVSGGGAGEGGEGGGPAPLWMRVLNQQKYPATQLFLMMTLGPAIALLPWAERARSWWANALVTIGRVPMFYYLLHILAIHVAALVTNQLRSGQTGSGWYATAPYAQVPPEQQWSLGLLYLVWALVIVVILYPACRWYAGLKARNPGGWMQYL